MSIEKLVVHESDIIKTILEFLSSRNYHVTMRTLEKESCTVNCGYSDDMLYIRELILDGDFGELLQLANSLATRMRFDEKRFRYLVLYQKFIELIYLRSHIVEKEQKSGVADVIRTLSELEIYCPSKEDYNELCWLLTLPNLHAHESFRNWTLDTSRSKCFKDLVACFEDNQHFGCHDNTSDPDRLLQLLVKGLFYELCTEYCQSVANGDTTNLNKHVDVLTSTSDSSPSDLFCWIQSLPYDIFQEPFQKIFVDIQYLNTKDKPTKSETLSFGSSYRNEEPVDQQEYQPKQTEHLNGNRGYHENDHENNHIYPKTVVEPEPKYSKVAEQKRTVSPPPSSPGILQDKKPEKVTYVSKSHEPFISDTVESNEIYHSTPVTSSSLRHSVPIIADEKMETHPIKDYKTQPETKPINSTNKTSKPANKSFFEDMTRKLDQKQTPHKKEIHRPPIEPTPSTNEASDIKQPELMEPAITSAPLTTAPLITENDDVAHTSNHTDENEDQNDCIQPSEAMIAVDQEEKENIPSSQKDVVLGPVINGVRRPISEKYLGARKAQENASSAKVEIPEPVEMQDSPPLRKSKDGHHHTNVQEAASNARTAAPESLQRRSSDTEQRYTPVEMLQDSQAVRSVAFHPNGSLYAIGANSKMLRICRVANSYQQLQRGEKFSMEAVFKRSKYHRGSIYCMAWNHDGRLLASGSNDKSIKILEFDADNYTQINNDYELNIHQGTIRELAFVPNKPGILVSGGAGDGSINVTDVFARKVVGTLNGHTGNVLTVYAGDNNLVVTGGADNTLRLWDLRSERCIDVVMVGEISPASVTFNSKYIASGQEDGSILIYDMAAGRTIQNFRLHQSDCRSVRFSPDSKYLLTSSYDKTVSLMHLHRHLYEGVPMHYVVAQHQDKVIQSRWHPTENIFLTSSADKTAVLWKAY